VFGLTLANLPRTPEMTKRGKRMLAFHSELTFLVRSFFFVVLGIMAQFAGRAYILPMLGILAAIVAARWLAVRATSWSIRDISKSDTELLFLMFPRGLITAVLALQVLSAKGQQFFYLPAMAFTVVVFTNIFVVVAAVRSKKGAVALVPAEPEAPELAV
jgi:cell volume regulation protein A